MLQTAFATSPPLCSFQPEEADLRFRLELHSGLVQFIETDVGKLRQILINLLGNAVKYTREGGFSLSARSEIMAGFSDRVSLDLAVKDSGPGIEAQDIKNILEPFVQVKQNHRDITDSTGLGLAITKPFVDLLGGKFSVTSSLGEGATFQVNLPVTVVNVPTEDTSKASVSVVTGIAPG